MVSGPVPLWLIANLAAGGIAAAVYSIWAYKWIRHGAPWLAFLNVLVGAACLGFGIGYALILRDAVAHSDAAHMAFRFLSPVVLLVPAATRYIELRREERREAFAEKFTRTLREAD